MFTSKPPSPKRSASTVVTEPPYLPISALSSIALEVLDPEEAARVYYDEPHHWTVTYSMWGNPAWGSEHDVGPDMSIVLRSKLQSRYADLFVSALKGLVTVGGFLLTLGLLATLVLPVYVLYTGRHYEYLVLATVIFVVSVFVCVLWDRYIRRLAERYRVIITAKRILVVIRQRPWRTESQPYVLWKDFRGEIFQRTYIGKLLGYVDVIIRSHEEEEPVPALIRMPKEDVLRAIFAWKNSLRT